MSDTIFGMDDSKFNDMSVDDFLAAQGENPEPTNDEENLEPDTENELDSEPELNDNESDEDLEEGDDDEEEFEDDDESEEDSDDEESEEDDEELDEEDDSGSDNEAHPDLEKLFTPFKAAGSEFTIKSVDEAIELAKKGLDYNRKMVALKPHRQLLKLLDNNSMLDQEKLNFAIDLMSGNKEAITKLVADHNIDVMDINTTESGNYTPSNRQVSDTAVELDDVIDSIKSTPTFADTMQTVTKDWDEASKRAIVSQPKLLSLINEHKSNGVFAMVQERVHREQLMGGLSGLSDFDAYRAAGDLIYKEGGFTAPGLENKPEPTKKIVSSKPKVDTELNNRRKKASQSKGTKPKGKKNQSFTSQDIIDMSDEDFANFKPF